MPCSSEIDMTVIVTVECPDQPVKVLVREKWPYPQSDTVHWVRRNEKASFSVWGEKRIEVEEHPEDKTFNDNPG
jgi:hypothetical protein